MGWLKQTKRLHRCCPLFPGSSFKNFEQREKKTEKTNLYFDEKSIFMNLKNLDASFSLEEAIDTALINYTARASHE